MAGPVGDRLDFVIDEEQTRELRNYMPPLGMYLDLGLFLAKSTAELQREAHASTNRAA